MRIILDFRFSTLPDRGYVICTVGEIVSVGIGVGVGVLVGAIVGVGEAAACCARVDFDANAL